MTTLAIVLSCLAILVVIYAVHSDDGGRRS